MAKKKTRSKSTEAAVTGSIAVPPVKKKKKKTRRKTSSRRKKPAAPTTEEGVGKRRSLAEVRQPAEAAPPKPQESGLPSRDIGFSEGIINGGSPPLEGHPTGKVDGKGDVTARPTARRRGRRGRGGRRKKTQRTTGLVETQEKDGVGLGSTEDSPSRKATPDKPSPTTRRARGKSAAQSRADSGKAVNKVVNKAVKKKTKAGKKTRPETQTADSEDAGLPVSAAPKIDFDESEYDPVDAEAPDAEAPDAEAPDDIRGAEEAGRIQAEEKEPRTEDKEPLRKQTAKKTTTKERTRERTRERTGVEKREMLINVSDGDECRIALLRDGRLEELYIERATSASNVGNIYKGRVTNVESSIQAAFIECGLPSHGFLHISDLHPKYFPGSKGEPELVGKKTPRRHRPPIQNALRPGQELIVQVIKEGIGTKGPTLSSYISLPGRFLVMMPDMSQLGVSRKIEDEDQRRKLRDLLGQLSLPNDTGFIVRTAGVDRTKRDLQRDLNYMARLWKKVVVRIKSEPAPAELYKESDLVIRTIRDVYDSTLNRIVVDSSSIAEKVREFLKIASPRAQDIVTCYDETEPMFHRFGIESEIEKLHARQVKLPCGGSLVIEQTEALVAIDVNSGRFRVPDDAEETAYRVNLEAVDEIARQLRLRDLGGLIILDLIDMLQQKHQRTVERRMSDALKKHKERAKILRISKFGILEMTRQRQRPSFAKSIFRDCPRCGGSGHVKATESVALDVMRRIRLASHTEGVARIDVHVSRVAAHDLLNRKRHAITDIERNTGQTIRIHGEADYMVDEVRISCTDRRGREVPGAVALTGIDAREGIGDNDRKTTSGARKRGGRSRRSGRQRK